MRKPKFGKRTIALAMCLLMAASLLPAVAFAVTFPDTEDHWAKAPIDRWHGYEIVLGDEETGLFRPEDPITRGEMATVMNRLMRYQTAAANRFSDLDDSAWYTDAILRAVAAGVIRGHGGDATTTVAPEDYISREQAFAILRRAFGVAENPDVSQFTDAGDISAWAVPEVGGLAARGFVEGYDGEVSPQANILRGEVAHLLDNMIEVYVNAAAEVDEVETANFALVNAADVIFNDADIEGTLFIAQGLVDGEFTLNDSTVTELVIQGGSIILNNSTIGILLVDNTAGDVRIYLDGTEIETVIVLVDDNAVIFDGVGEIGTIFVVEDADLEVADDIEVGETIVIEPDPGPGNGNGNDNEFTAADGRIEGLTEGSLYMVIGDFTPYTGTDSSSLASDYTIMFVTADGALTEDLHEIGQLTGTYIEDALLVDGRTYTVVAATALTGTVDVFDHSAAEYMPYNLDEDVAIVNAVVTITEDTDAVLWGINVGLDLDLVYTVARIGDAPWGNTRVSGTYSHENDLANEAAGNTDLPLFPCDCCEDELPIGLWKWMENGMPAWLNGMTVVYAPITVGENIFLFVGADGSFLLLTVEVVAGA